MKVIVASLLLAASTAGIATPGRVGTTGITIPAPVGFAPATPDMQPLYSLLGTFVADVNGELVSFLEQSDAAEALQGNIPKMRRRFSAQYPLATAHTKISAADFAEISRDVEAGNAETARTLATRNPGLMDRANQDLSRVSDSATVLSIPELVPLPAHEQDEWRYSYSAHVTHMLTDEAGNAVAFVSVLNATLLRVRGKLLLLYTFGSEDDLEWVRSAGSAWAADVIDANPDLHRSGSAWTGAAMRGLFTGAAVVAVLMVLARVRNWG